MQKIKEPKQFLINDNNNFTYKFNIIVNKGQF